MPPQKKEALHTLISSLIFFGILLILPVQKSVHISEQILVIVLIYIISLWLIRFRSQIKLKELNSTEMTIRMQAAIFAAHILGAIVAVYSICLYLLHRDGGQIPLYQVLLLAIHSWLGLYISWSSTILILSRRGAIRFLSR